MNTIQTLPKTPTVDLPCFVVPYTDNGDFVGRDNVLKQMHETLKPDHAEDGERLRTFALCGLGGMGKTQTAVTYVLRHRGDYRAVFWYVPPKGSFDV